MNIEELYAQYQKDYKKACDEYQVWREDQIARARGAQINTPNLPYSGFEVNYSDYVTKIGQAIKEEFGFTDKQVGHIMHEAYERFHSGFSDMFYGACSIATFVKEFLTL